MQATVARQFFPPQFNVSSTIIMARVIHSPRSRHKQGRDWPTPEKNCRLGRMEAGQLLHQISKETGVHRDTLRAWRNRCHVYTDRRRGKERDERFRKASSMIIREMLRWVLSQVYKDRKLSYSSIIKEINLKLSIPTLRWISYYKCTACLKSVSSELQRQTRFAFAKKFESWTHEWNRVRFSDKCTFYTNKHKKNQIICFVKKRFCQTQYHSDRRFFFVWGMVEWGFKSELIFFLENLSDARGGMTKIDYVKWVEVLFNLFLLTNIDYVRQIWCLNVSPYLSEVNYVPPYENTPFSPVQREYEEVLFQEDENRVHNLKSKQNMHQLERSFGIPLFNDEEWSLSSSDLNIIENVWRIIKQRIESYVETLTTWYWSSNVNETISIKWNLIIWW